MGRINLVDMGFNSFSNDEKRLSFITMDLVMKDKHKNNKMITSFMPQDIYYDNETQLFDFGKVSDISTYVADSKEEAIREDIIELSTLAFCSYLKTYDPKDGLLNNGVIATEFDKFTNVFNPEDMEYYRKVLVDGYNNKEIKEPMYYSEYLIDREKNKEANGNNNGNGIALVKATEVGRAMADMNEAAFSHTFYMACMVTASMIAVVGLIIYILSTI